MEATSSTATVDTTDTTIDAAAQVRRARFGTLPEPIPYSAMIEEQPATPRADDGYDAEHSWLHYSCVALDLAF
jgi:hypothetical protein